MADFLKPQKRWPKRKELLAWFMWDKFWETTLGETENPEDILKWLDEFENTPLLKTHDRLYSTYDRFFDTYADPMTYPNKEYTS